MLHTLEGLDAPVAGGSVADLLLALDGLGRLVEHGGEADDALALGAKLEEALLDLGAEVDARGDLVRDRDGVEVEVVELRLGRGDDAGVGCEALLDLVLVGRVGLVREHLHLGRPEGAPVGQPDELEALPCLDDDVQAPVGEVVEHLDDVAARADVPHAFVVLEQEPEVAAEIEALPDQLAVARLEDVQRRLLAGNEHEVEGEEADLVHRRTG